MEPISVVIPTRNRLSTLVTALHGVLGQVGVEVRVVVVDEASSDDTPRFLDELGDDRVHVVRNEAPRGLGGARNCGVEKTSTRLVAFCDDDDVWAPDKLRAQLDAMAATPSARWSCTGNVSVDTGLHIVGYHRPTASGDIHEQLRAINVVPAGGSSVLVERDLFDEVDGFDETMHRCEDYDLWVRLGRRSPIATVDRPLIAYRVWPNSMSTDIEGMREGHALVVQRYRGEIDAATAREADLRHEMYLGRFYVRAGRRVDALRHYVATARRFHEPRQALHGVAAFLVPAATGRWRDRHERRRVPSEWAAAAEAWLGVVRDGV